MESIQIIAENIKLIADSLSAPDSFWNTQWFAALIGATAALLVTSLRDIISKRNKSLNDFYNKMAESGTSLSLDSIGEIASATSYGHTRTEDGVSEVIPEKAFAEKIIIELRKRCKYWRLPISRLRFMLGKYESLLNNIPDKRRGYKNLEEYKKADEYFKKVMEFVYKKTGEDEWTAR